MEREKRVDDIMSRELVTLEPNQRVSDVDALMKLEDVHHFPVVDEDSQLLVGIVSQRDVLLNALMRAVGYGSYAGDKVKRELLVKDIMQTDVVTTTRDASVRAVAKIMRERRISCVPVLDGDRPCGIVTVSDLLELVATQG